MAFPIIGAVVFVGIAVVVVIIGDHLAKGISQFFDKYP